ncbi:MAG: hypothetical protein HOV81_32260 [Kofleriaceae bacterium]|nr:hypothetical protein [Kofleriaceae bacterium]
MRYVLVLSLVVGVRVAAAEDAEPAPPGFTLLDRFDEDSRVGADVTYQTVVGNRYFVRGDVHAHYIDDRYHIGGYAQVQRWYSRRPTPTETERYDGTGSPELGLLYAMQPWTRTSLVLRAGVTLPTVEESGTYMGVNAQVNRPTDLFQHRPGGSIRLSASSITHAGAWFGRVDVGIDQVFMQHYDHDARTGVRGNLGAGYDLERAAIMAEVSTLTVRTNGELEMVPSGALSVRGKLGRVQPYACVSLPVFASYYDWAAMLGADVSL